MSVAVNLYPNPYRTTTDRTTTIAGRRQNNGDGRELFSGLPFQAEYISTLLREADIPAGELRIVENNLSKNLPPDSRAWALYALCLLKRVTAKRQLSPRYNEFTRTLTRLIKNGGINFSAGAIDAGVFAQADENNIILNSRKNLGDWPPLKIEATLIHELFHLYQRQEKRKLSWIASEAEAHLIEGDYRDLSSPGPRSENDWLVVGGPRNSTAFNVPPSAAQEARSGGVERVLARIANNYELTFFFTRIIPSLPPVYSPPPQGRLDDNAYLRLLQNETDVAFAKIADQPLASQIIACRKYHQGISGCDLTTDLAIFGQSALYLAQKSMMIAGREAAQRSFNHYFIELWQGQSLANSPLDLFINQEQPK